MSDLLQQAKEILLAPTGMDFSDITEFFKHLQKRTVDIADLYFQASYYESWSLNDGLVKSANYSSERGVGARIVSGERTGFAYSDSIAAPALNEAVLAARSIIDQGQNYSTPIKYRQTNTIKLYYPTTNPLSATLEQDKIDLLYQIDRIARGMDPKIKQVSATLVGCYETVLIVNHRGDFVADIRPLVRLNVQVIAEQGNERSSGYAGGGGRYDYNEYMKDDLVLHYTQEAVRQALLKLEAVEAPAGEMPVVLGSGWPGVLLHEAVGHGLEGDFNRKGSSAFAKRMGEKVATSLCTIVDDGTLANRRGSLNVDDEGTPTQCTTLIEKGILKNYMQDNMNAGLMKTQSTGNGRRESYADLPMPRMTNTYMLPGKHDPEEIIQSVDYGLYAVNFDGGQVDITSGKFVFSANEAYIIKNGKITTPVKGATLIGNGPDVLTRVSMVGNDLALDSGVGICGKNGQTVPVGVGQPTLKVDRLTVGGTKV